MTPDQIATWAAAGESQTLELKRTTGALRVPFQSDVAAKGPRHEKDQRT